MKRLYMHVTALLLTACLAVYVALPGVAFASPGVAPECSEWFIVWDKTPSGWWYGQWAQWCYSPSWGWWQNFAGWFWS